MPVKLELSSGRTAVDPRDDEIRDMLASLDIARDGEGFAILEFDQMTYLQVAGDANSGFVMEVQDGDTDRHYQSTRDDFTLDETVAAMTAYRDGTVNWDDFGTWEKMEI